jgi:hypothetical protein
MYFYILTQQPNVKLQAAHEQEDTNQTKLRQGQSQYQRKTEAKTKYYN